VEKPVAVLSGGERARLCLAGLMLSELNVLILDEPGNHLDVETVEALADALLAYQGTVIFTSHDRHFLSRVATCIIEVRDGRVTNFNGGYAAYLYQVNKDIEAGERELATAKAKLPAAVAGLARSVPRVVRRSEKEIRKELKATERTIAQLDARRKEASAEFMATDDADEAGRLEADINSFGAQLAEAEDQWVQLNEELGEAE
jgi:ATP-binding cassette subfamily F protein 3